MIIRLTVDGVWSIDQFSDFLRGIQSVSELYEFGGLEALLSVEDGAVRLRSARRGTPLGVHRLEYASPGLVEIVAQPETLAPVLSFLQLNIYLFVKRNERQANAKFVQAKADLIDHLREKGGLSPEIDLEKIISSEDPFSDNGIDEIISAASQGRFTDAVEVNDRL